MNFRPSVERLGDRLAPTNLTFSYRFHFDFGTGPLPVVTVPVTVSVTGAVTPANRLQAHELADRLMLKRLPGLVHAVYEHTRPPSKSQLLGSGL